MRVWCSDFAVGEEILRCCSKSSLCSMFVCVLILYDITKICIGLAVKQSPLYVTKFFMYLCPHSVLNNKGCKLVCSPWSACVNYSALILQLKKIKVVFKSSVCIATFCVSSFCTILLGCVYELVKQSPLCKVK